MNVKDIAASLGQALGSGRTGALSVGAVASAGVDNLQDRLNGEFSKVGSLLGKYGGTSFTDSIASGATKGAVATQEQMVGTVLERSGVTPTVMYVGAAVIIGLVILFWGERG